LLDFFRLLGRAGSEWTIAAKRCRFPLQAVNLPPQSTQALVVPAAFSSKPILHVQAADTFELVESEAGYS